MTQIGTDAEPLRVAIVGSGPAGFYAAEHFFKQRGLVAEVDMFDRLPTPFGLVRFGVAPDHQKIKKVTKVYDKVAANDRFRFFGNVAVGTHVRIEELKQHYHQICFATGAQTDRQLGIPGEELHRSHPATEFVAWYNGHPDYRDLDFDLSVERVAVVGVGNVAVDVARILCRTTEELTRTDIADYALEALALSRVKEVFVIGRRGAAQAAFTNAEIKELGELEGADLSVRPDEVALDPLSQADIDGSQDKALVRKVEILQQLASRNESGKERTLTLRFLVSPVAIDGDEAGNVVNMRLVKNELYRSDDGSMRPRATDNFEDLPVGLVFRSVGYRGVAVPGLPFNDSWGVVPNDKGRVVESDSNEPLVGLYVTGWIKRGPSGVIGTNKPDAVETVNMMIADLAADKILRPVNRDPVAMSDLVSQRQPDFFSYEDWQSLDRVEQERGESVGRPRIKFTSVDEMLDQLERDRS